MVGDVRSSTGSSRPSVFAGLVLLRRADWLATPLVIFIATRFTVFLVAFIGRVLLPVSPSSIIGTTPLSEVAAALIPDQGVISLAIAEHGHSYHALPAQNAPSIAPLYPLLVSGLSGTFGGAPAASVILSNVAFLTALVALYWVGKRKIGPDRARTGLILLSLIPWTFLWSSAYPYSLALLCAAAAFVALEKDQHFLSVLFATAGALTVPFLLALLLALLLEAGVVPDTRGLTGSRSARLAVVLAVPALAIAASVSLLVADGISWPAGVAMVLGLGGRPNLIMLPQHLAAGVVVVWPSIFIACLLLVAGLALTKPIGRIIGRPYAVYVAGVLIVTVVVSPEEVGAAVGLAFPAFFTVAHMLERDLAADLAVIVSAVVVGLFTPLFSTAWLVNGTISYSPESSRLENLVSIYEAQTEGSGQGLGLLAGDDLLILGHGLIPGTYAPGDMVSVPIEMHVLRSTTRAYVVSAHLLDRTGRRWAFADRPLFEDGATPSLISGERIRVDVPLRAGPEVPTGEYLVSLSVAELSFKSTSYTGIEVRSLEGEVQHPIVLGSALIFNPEDTLEERDLALQNPVRAWLGQVIELVGFEVNEGTRDGRAELEVALYWRAASRLENDYTVFVQLLDSAGSLVAQRDSYPMNGRLSTSGFVPGIVFRDTHVVAVPLLNGAGRYRLIVGMYDLETLQRLPVQQGVSRGSVDYVDLGEVTLESP